MNSLVNSTLHFWWFLKKLKISNCFSKTLLTLNHIVFNLTTKSSPAVLKNIFHRYNKNKLLFF